MRCPDALSGGTVILNGICEHKPTSVLAVEKTFRSSHRTSPRLSITDGDQPEPCR